MAINDSREEKAQLGRREFDLDTEEQERQRKERDARIVKVKIHSVHLNGSIPLLLQRADAR